MSGRRAARLGVGGVIATAAMAGLVLAAAAAGSRPGAPRTPPPEASPGLPGVGSAAPSPQAGVVHGRVTVSVITIELALSQRAARTGQPIQVRATVTNQAAGRTPRATVRLVAIPGGIRLRPEDLRSVPALAGGGSETLTWIACVRVPGTYTFTAEVTLGGTVVRSLPQQLAVAAGGSC